jgi:hypothetical protein
MTRIFDNMSDASPSLRRRAVENYFIEPDNYIKRINDRHARLLTGEELKKGTLQQKWAKVA